MNNIMLVGRLARDIYVKKLDSGKEVAKITLAVNRSFKNTEGIYETDFIDCILWDGLAINMNEYCKKGDLVGVRGRLQISSYEKDDVQYKVLEVVAEKVSFLSSVKKEDQEES